MDKIRQEFYCGNCSGYFRIKLAMNYDRIIHLNCPNCGHQHKRKIVSGIIKEEGRDYGDAVEEIVVPKSAYSKEPLSEHFRAARAFAQKRDGIKLTEDDLVREQMMIERWSQIGHDV